jgi:hypothetical protein
VWRVPEEDFQVPEHAELDRERVGDDERAERRADDDQDLQWLP